jgi:hypothetical protein
MAVLSALDGERRRLEQVARRAGFGVSSVRIALKDLVASGHAEQSCEWITPPGKRRAQRFSFWRITERGEQTKKGGPDA